MLCIKKAVVAVLCLCAASLIHGAVKIADLVTPCSLKDPQLNECLTTQGKAILPYLVAGVPDLDMVPIDPLYVPEAIVRREGGQYHSLNLTMTNSTHLGYKDVAINSIRFDPKSYELNLNMFFSWYNVSGIYDANGYLLFVPIYGNGKAEKLNFSSITNNLLNRNSAAVLAETKSDVGQVFSNVTASLLTDMFAKIPLKELFKDVE